MLHYLSPKCLVSALFDLKVNQNKVEDSIRKPKAAYQRGTDNAMTDRKKKTQTMVSKILYRKQLFEQKHKQWSTKYYTENNYLSKKSLKIPKE
jgi:hypothetical protein